MVNPFRNCETLELRKFMIIRLTILICPCFYCRIRINFLNHLEEWTEQASERAQSVVVAKVNSFHLV